ncbi:MAG: ATP-binding protein, partial [Deltaproteobacteria bacterium]|nr:ATP-binding protein [Deltaproteobacteria bacterium]
MGSLLQAFTFDRNTFRRTAEESADSVAHHIEKVRHGDELDKIASNIAGALASYMGIFAKGTAGQLVPTELAKVFLMLYAANKADSWRWLVARSLWRFVVPNGTACKVNTPAQKLGIKFAFFHAIVQLLTHLSALSENKRFLYFEELCRLLVDDAHWKLPGDELFARVIKARSNRNNGFGSERSFLADLENKSNTERGEFDIPRDNFNGLFLKAFAQTSFFQFLDGKEGRKVAVALNPNLDAVLQRRIRFILDHPPNWIGTDWPSYMDIQTNDLPQEVTAAGADEEIDFASDLTELADLVSSARAALSASGLYSTPEQLLRLTASLESKRFLILTGVAGSGKTKLAQAFARWLTPNAVLSDPLGTGCKIQSERIVYHVKASDLVAVEFWNSENEEEATKVVLPRELITEWAAYIQTNRISRQSPAREIREGVKAKSKFSDQLHSFETHLKAAAFALVDASTVKSPASCY